LAPSARIERATYRLGGGCSLVLYFKLLLYSQPENPAFMHLLRLLFANAWYRVVVLM